MNIVIRYLPIIGRIFIAAIFLSSGYQKLGMPQAVIGRIGSMGLPLPQVGYALSLMAELGAGTLLVIGYRTRTAAAGLAFFTLVTALIFHSNFADRDQATHFMKNLSMLGGLLQVVAFGGSSISLDAWLAARRTSSAAAS